LLLDEPTTGLAPVAASKQRDAIRDLAAAGTDALLTTQSLDEADHLASHIVVGAAAGVAEDLEQGFVDRLRSLLIPRTAVLAGRAVADTAVQVWGLVITTAIGFAVGFRIHGSVQDALLAFALLVAFGFAFEWLFITLGLVAGNAQAAQGLALLVFPLTFVSSAYVPVETMPGWLQALAEHQPITVMVDAVRALTQGPAAEAMLGHDAGYYVLRSLVWAAAIVAVFAPLAIARYRRG
jgi:ABC-2 type transport system permease protein